MDLKGIEILKLSKEASTEYVTGSRKVTQKPCWVLNVVAHPTNAGAVTLGYLRNGEIVTAEILYAYASQYSFPTHMGILPIYFNKGLYIELNTNLTGMTVQYLVDK